MIGRRVVILGVTGSIGRQSVEVCRHLGLEVAAIAARSPSSALVTAAEQLPGATVIATGGSSEERAEFVARLPGRLVEFGADSLLAAAGLENATVINGVVGAAGLRGSEAALTAGNRLALANKESLVVAGEILTRLAREGDGEIIPVDSEHSALYQLVQGEQPNRLILTASGGPFRGWTREALEEVTPDQALRHPTWEMGPRITVDSATLANKGLEVIEAHFLFGLGFDQIDVLVHPQSVVHSLVEMADGALLAHLGATDMRIPIQYALTYPARAHTPLRPFSLVGESLTFEEPDRAAFPALDLAYSAGRMGGAAPAVFNAADEVAVAAFLQERLGFTAIPKLIETCLDQMGSARADSVEEAMEIDAEARSFAANAIAGAC